MSCPFTNLRTILISTFLTKASTSFLTELPLFCIILPWAYSGNDRMLQVPRVLTVAGSDSGGGAGIQADLKTYQARGVFGASAISALTAQNTRGVKGVHTVPSQHLSDQMEAVLSDIGADVIKTGMLPTAEVGERPPSTWHRLCYSCCFFPAFLAGEKTGRRQGEKPFLGDPCL